MSLNVIIAQVLALMGLASNILSVQSKKRRNVLIFQVAANVLYGVQYIFLDAWSALAVCAVSAIECVVVYYYAEKKGQPRMPLPALVAIIIATIVAGMFSFDHGDIIFSWIPIIVTVAYSWAVWQPNLRIFRIVAAAIPACWFVYNFHVAAYVSVATAVVEFASALAAIVRIDILGKKEPSTNLV